VEQAGLQAAADTPTPALAAAPAGTRAALLVELAARMCWYGRFKGFEPALGAACSTMDFEWEVTGVLGIKRMYQSVEFAQMLVKTKSGVTAKTPAVADAEEGKKPESLPLLSVDDMTDVLEGPRISASVEGEERQALERPLTAVEQLVLLARCHYLWAASNTNDEMVLQEVNALAQRVLATEEKPVEADASDGPMLTANWLTFSCGLFYRCRAEHHRNKTRERAAFQLQSLVDQFKDERPSAGHRLLLVHGAGYPARFHLQRELGMRMMKMGMVSTAHEQFKRLRMWPEAVDCLMVAERNVEAMDMVKELLEASPTPRLWCCLGDLEKEPKHFEKAWELSKHRFARAQRSLGRHFFGKGQLAEAIEAFKLAVAINPLHGGIWFTMGCCQMKLERYEEAVLTFIRCIGVEDENAEAWANLAACHSALESHKEARTCMAEATKRSRQSWRMWESFMGICLTLRDVQGVIQALKRMVELEQAPRIKERVLGMITMAVVTDKDGLHDSRTGRAFTAQLSDFFSYLTSRVSSVPWHWRFYAELQISNGEAVQALESRLKQNRAAQAKIWEERDPESFDKQLEDLKDCFLTVEEMLSEPQLVEQARQNLQSFAYSVRNAAQTLQAKIDKGVENRDWAAAVSAFTALVSRLEERAAKLSTGAAVAEGAS